ncbi:MAG TPA: 30S ribosomal protein S16 [Oligoflexia bacterium]|nr:30S ribosomal protein S16 [Oligoflexia bacterium]HMR25435.1 30S ribosomal protein S16 [Oligoflexia bacterium]
MVKIRMSRYGRKKSPFYRIVAVDERKRRESDYIELLGFYNPQRKEEFKIDKDRVNYWISQGAQTSETVAKLIKNAS